jgi:tol-pal system protein YbgF
MASAASIWAHDVGHSNAVVIAGDISPADDREFARVVGSLKDPVIFLSSRGGSVVAAINIGKFIRMRGWSTVVAEDQLCASACGLIWLGGVNRFMARTARIGFHAAYRVEGESQIESGVGNALVGAYLNALGLADGAILYITSPAPTEVRWLSLADARALGITVSASTFGSPPPDGGGRPAPSLSNTPELAPKTAPQLASPSEQYNFAFALLRRADYAGAAQALRTFIQLYPNDALAGNAQYWLGETYYAREDFSNAAAAFAEGYQKYPRNGKAADGLFKLGMALGRLGQNADACRALARLDRDFPSAPAPIRERANDLKKHLAC